MKICTPDNMRVEMLAVNENATNIKALRKNYLYFHSGTLFQPEKCCIRFKGEKIKKKNGTTYGSLFNSAVIYNTYKK